MQRLILAALAAFAIVALPASAARGAGSHPLVHVLVVVPTSYTSNATPGQAVAAVQTWLGQPSDAPCIGSTSCTIEGWFKHELGQVFDYQVQTVNVPQSAGPGTDACGQGGDVFRYMDWVKQLTGLSFGVSERDMEIVMGLGGWAGHWSPTDRKVDHLGAVGDWGVMEQFNARNACIPDWDYPARGFSHEFAGMMGEFVTAGYNEGGLFVGDPMSANEKSDLLHYSGKWLYAAG